MYKLKTHFVVNVFKQASVHFICIQLKGSNRYYITVRIYHHSFVCTCSVWVFSFLNEIEVVCLYTNIAIVSTIKWCLLLQSKTDIFIWL